MKTLPDDGKLRKSYPIGSGCYAYFPAALAGVARHSYIAGAKYNEGALLHLRWKGGDNLDCVDRHMMDIRDLLAAKSRGETHMHMYTYNFDEKAEELVEVTIDEAILVECNALSWRSLAFSQEIHEQLTGAPLAPAARLEP
jgi:hypothetical protein